MHVQHARWTQALTMAALVATVLAVRPAAAQLSGASGSTTGSSCTASSGDGFCGFARTTTVSTGSTFQSRYTWNINADVGVLSTRDSDGSAQHNMSFNASAVGGYRLDIATSFVGDMNRINDAPNCDGAANVSGVSGSSNIGLSSGGLSVGDPGSIGNGGDDTSIPFNGNSNATIFRVSNSVPQSHTLTFTWNGSVRSNSCEAAVRIGQQNGTTSGCDACGYPGTPARTQSSDGHVVTVTFTSLCGNGSIDASAGEQCDQGGANGSATSCCTSQCQFRASGQVCRTGGGAPCDVNETCTGSSATCPADDAPGKAGVTCNTGSGDVCDPSETCTGVPGQGCPSDTVRPASFVCRTGSGDVCDPSETCTGIPDQPCPVNFFRNSSFVCNTGSGDLCDTNETCPGLAGAQCPSDDAVLNAGVVCRGGSGDVCDQNETCTGTPNLPCPADDAPSKLGVVCRASSASGAFCDLDEACSGVPLAPCPPDDAPTKVNVVCRPGSGDQCDPTERCTGIPGQDCPQDVVAPPTTVCNPGSGDLCDPAEQCTGIPTQACPADTVASAGTECRGSAGECDPAEQCSGVADQACPGNTFVTPGTPCNADGDACTVDTCNGSGACAFANPLDCDDGNTCTQDSCDSGTGCVITGAPSNTCVQAVRGSLQYTDKTVDKADGVKMKWQGGPVLLSDLGNPTLTTRYELCIYDASGVKMAMGVPPGAGWSVVGSPTSPKGYKYKNKTGLGSSGVTKMTLKASSVDRAKLDLKAKGVEVPETTTPFTPSVQAQLYGDGGRCWDVTIDPAEVRKNVAGSFKGKTP